MKVPDFPIIMRQGVGFVLLTFALLAVPKAIGAIVNLCVLASIGFPTETDADKYMTNLLTHHATSAMANIATFVILLLLARWIFRGPKLLEGWIASGSEGDGKPESEPDNH